MKINWITLSTRVTEEEAETLNLYLKKIGHTPYSILKEFVNGLLVAAEEIGVDSEELPPPLPMAEDETTTDSELLG